MENVMDRMGKEGKIDRRIVEGIRILFCELRYKTLTRAFSNN